SLALLALWAGGTLSAGRPHRANGTIEAGQACGTGRPDLALQAPEALLTLDALSPGCTGIALGTFLTDWTHGTGRANLTLSARGASGTNLTLSACGTGSASGTRLTLDALRACRTLSAARAHRAGDTVEP